MSSLQVVKRDGRKVKFDPAKISSAISRVFDATEEHIDDLAIADLVSAVQKDFKPKIDKQKISVEDIQDSVEKVLAENGYTKAAKDYILYRKERERQRNAKAAVLDYKKLVDEYLGVADWRVKENSTVQYSLGGLILSNSGAVTANYWLDQVYDEEIREAHKSCAMHIHDLSMLSGYCAGWSLKQLIQEGLGGVPGKITSAPASHLATLCNQMVNFLGIMQNEWAGAQAFSSFDTYLAPFVKVDNLTQKEVKQAVQAFVFGTNTPSRWGCVTEDTEVLTADGFKKYNELSVGDMIYSWVDGTLVLNPVNNIVVKQYSGKIHEYVANGYKQAVSPDHRVLIKKHNVDEYLIAHSDSIIDAKTPYMLPTAFEQSDIADCALSDDQIMLAAMVYTDGSIDMRGDSVHKVSLYKSPNRYGSEVIEQICGRMNLEYTKSQSDGAFGPVNKYSFYGDSARIIKDLVGSKQRIHDRFLQMSARQAWLFLKTWASFDGDEDKMRLQYDNEAIADALQHIAILAGKCSYHYNNGKANYIKVRLTDHIIPKERNKVEYSGIIWCPCVDAGTAVFRNEGTTYVSGQCQAPFTNCTFDWKCPDDMAVMPAIVGGKEMDFTYGDCQKEMDMVNKAFLEIMIEGDANGRGFQYPIKFVA